jgi:hypothetical protein
VPLEGLDPIALEESTRVALECGFVDELDLLSSSATALFDLMISLPRGETKRELGRRVLRTLHQCDAHTFVALATGLAIATPKVLARPQARARVALCLQLPYGLVPEVDALALALISSPKLAGEWLVTPSSGSLPQRRLAARLLERAAREAWRQHHDGNRVGLRVFRSDFVSEAWQRLLSERESLTWRHVAAARGLLVDLIPEFDEEVRNNLRADSGPGEWRRGMTSLAASIAVRQESSLQACRDQLATERAQENPGISGSMLFGIVSAAAFHIDTAQELLTDLAMIANIEAAQSIVEIQREHISADFVDQAALILRQRLEEDLHSKDDGLAAHAGALLDELGTVTESTSTVQGNVLAAMQAYTDSGPAAAKEATISAVECADHTMGELREGRDQSSAERRMAFRALREIELGLLENNALRDLLLITHVSSEELDNHLLDEVHANLSWWLLSFEESNIDSSELQHLSWRLARLKALIHQVDADGANPKQQENLRARRELTLSIFRDRVRYDETSRLRRMVVVTLARACDASLREDWYELSDMLIGILPCIKNQEDLEVFTEASLISEMEVLSRAYTELVARGASGDFASMLDAHDALVAAFPWSGSPRVEALRAALADLGSALLHVKLAHCRAALLHEGQSSPLTELAASCQWLAQLTSGARRRLDIADVEVAPFLGRALRALDTALQSHEPVRDEIAGCIALLEEELPAAFASLVSSALSVVDGLPDTAPAESPSAEPVVPLRSRRASHSAPVRDNVAGFQVLRALGDGGQGSVHIACRDEDRDQETPALFALKRPQFSEQHAQVLSEGEFVDLFRQEAGILLTLPPHDNLAGFVTFDLGAKPDPILVMEYIEGPDLGRLLEAGDFAMPQVLRLLDGIAAGLEAMHKMEVGHLDIKPENIVVRGGNPVLVDFGLAGRQFRPGCATVYYGAPEVLSGEGRGPAIPADAYSFACLAFELLTSASLFDGESVQDFVRAHLSHDGNPPGLVNLSKSDSSLLALTQAIARCLRHDPRQRTSVSTFRSDLAGLAGNLGNRDWPLGRQ